MDLGKEQKFPLMHVNYTGASYAEGTKTYNLEVYFLYSYDTADSDMADFSVSDEFLCRT